MMTKNTMPMFMAGQAPGSVPFGAQALRAAVPGDGLPKLPVAAEAALGLAPKLDAEQQRRYEAWKATRHREAMMRICVVQQGGGMEHVDYQPYDSDPSRYYKVARLAVARDEAGEDLLYMLRDIRRDFLNEPDRLPKLALPKAVQMMEAGEAFDRPVDITKVGKKIGHLTSFKFFLDYARVVSLVDEFWKRLPWVVDGKWSSMEYAHSRGSDLARQVQGLRWLKSGFQSDVILHWGIVQPELEVGPRAVPELRYVLMVTPKKRVLPWGLAPEVRQMWVDFDPAALPMAPAGAWVAPFVAFLQRARAAQDAFEAGTGVVATAAAAEPAHEQPAGEATGGLGVEETLAPEKTGAAGPRERREKRAGAVVAPWLLAGMDGEALYREVVGNPFGYFACEVEGRVRLSAEVKRLLGEGNPAPRRDTAKGATRAAPRLVELEDAVVHSRLAAMEWDTFLSTVDARRHPARRMLEHRLGRKLHFHKADVVDLAPERLGDAAGVVAGLHRYDPDRLCVVRVVFRDAAKRPESYADRQALYARQRGKPPLVVKTKAKDGRLVRQKFRFARPRMLAVFPSGWMNPVAEPWMAGLFGTPFDPTLLEFCETMPKGWWREMKTLLPARDFARPVVDVREMVSEAKL